MLRKGMKVHVRKRVSEQWPYGLAYGAFDGTLQEDAHAESGETVVVRSDIRDFDVRVLAADLEPLGFEQARIALERAFEQCVSMASRYNAATVAYGMSRAIAEFMMRGKTMEIIVREAITQFEQASTPMQDVARKEE